MSGEAVVSRSEANRTAPGKPNPAGSLLSTTPSPLDWNFEMLAACPICQHVEALTVVERTVQGLLLRFSKCQCCGVIYQNPRMTRESLGKYFSSEIFIDDPNAGNLKELVGYPNYFNWDKTYTKTARLRLARIAKFKTPPAQLLEIGTATGSFLSAARSFGFCVKGLDLSTAFAETARKAHGLEIDLGYIEEFPLPSSHYDVICNFGGIACWRDPIRALSNIYQSLKPDGIFVMNHFDVDSLPGRILGDRHFEYNHASLIIFSRRTMQQCLDRVGFGVIYSQNERQYASLGRIAEYLKQKMTLKVLQSLMLEDLTIPMIVPGTVFSICRKKAS
jgi:SAM-dependent methyltransferase